MVVSECCIIAKGLCVYSNSVCAGGSSGLMAVVIVTDMGA